MHEPPYRLIAPVMSRVQCYQAIRAELNNMRGPVRKVDAKQLAETLSGTADMTDNLMSRFGAPWTQQSRHQIQARIARILLAAGILLLAPICILSSAYGREPALASVVSACASFAENGSSASVTVRGTDLSLEVTDPLGKASRLNLALFDKPSRWPTYGNIPPRGWVPRCDVFWNGTSHSIAVGLPPNPVAPAFAGSPLEVAVAEVKPLRWRGHFLVKATTHFTPVQLAGFFRGGDSLVVVKQAVTTDVTSTYGELYGSFGFGPTGRILSAVPTCTWRTPGKYLADAKHNRIWILPCQWYSARFSEQPLCSISSMPLAGRENVGNGVFNPLGHASKREEIWMVPGAIVAPDSHSILLAETIPIHGLDTIWSVDLHTQALGRLVLPRHAHFPSMDGASSADVSPDAQIAAISFDQFTHKFPWLTEDMSWTGKRIAIINIHPLQLIAMFPSGGAQRISAIAVDHRDGKIVILVFRNGRWELQTLIPPPES